MDLLSKSRHEKYSVDEVKKLVMNKFNELNKIPTEDDFTTEELSAITFHGMPLSNMILKLDLKNKVILESNSDLEMNRNRALINLIQKKGDLGHNPTEDDFTTLDQHELNNINKLFGNLNNAIEMADFSNNNVIFPCLYNKTGSKYKLCNQILINLYNKECYDIQKPLAITNYHIYNPYMLSKNTFNGKLLKENILNSEPIYIVCKCYNASSDLYIKLNDDLNEMRKVIKGIEGKYVYVSIRRENRQIKINDNIVKNCEFLNMDRINELKKIIVSDESYNDTENKIKKLNNSNDISLVLDVFYKKIFNKIHSEGEIVEEQIHPNKQITDNNLVKLIEDNFVEGDDTNYVTKDKIMQIFEENKEVYNVKDGRITTYIRILFSHAYKGEFDKYMKIKLKNHEPEVSNEEIIYKDSEIVLKHDVSVIDKISTSLFHNIIDDENFENDNAVHISKAELINNRWEFDIPLNCEMVLLLAMNGDKIEKSWMIPRAEIPDIKFVYLNVNGMLNKLFKYNKYETNTDYLNAIIR
jgi:hypothetical protein